MPIISLPSKTLVHLGLCGRAGESGAMLGERSAKGKLRTPALLLHSAGDADDDK
jgi:hypothetical protein